MAEERSHGESGEHGAPNYALHDSGTPEGDRGLIPERLPAGLKEYRGLYQKSIERREDFWRIQASRLVWDREFLTVVHENFSEGAVSWFDGGALNACRNALDVHIERGGADERALLYLDSDGVVRPFTFRGLLEETRKLAAALAAAGLARGDRFLLYLPDSPETVICLLACARIGLVAVPVPARYTADLVCEIAANCGASALLVASGSGSRSYDARARTVIEAFAEKTVIDAGVKTAEGAVQGSPNYANHNSEYHHYSDFVAGAGSSDPGCASVEAEHPLFILYANSAAGMPRGSVFATGGFLVQAAVSHDYLFRSTADGDGAKSLVCALDLSSAAGLCYGVWGPLANGSCTVIAAEGMHSQAERLRRALETCDSAALLTTPILLSELKRELGDAPLSPERRFALVASSGDVLKPRHISFAARTLVTAPERVLNLWMQTECGAAVIGTFPSAELNRSGALGLPFPGIRPLVVNHLGQACRPNESGQLVFSASWPSMIRTIWGQADRYRQLYFRRVPGYYSTNDGARVDGEEFYWFMGRLDDVIKVRGQSLATSEVEAVLASHPLISEAAVVGVEGEDGESLFAFLVLEKSIVEKGGEPVTAALEEELARSIERRIGEFTVISRFIVAQELPRTRTGKIVRRVLKRIAVGDITVGEDLSHVANPGAVEDLLRQRGL